MYSSQLQQFITALLFYRNLMQKYHNIPFSVNIHIEVARDTNQWFLQSLLLQKLKL